MKFKTNAKCGGCTSAITMALKEIAPAGDWKFDLSVPEKTLTYTGSDQIDPSQVIAVIKAAGFQAELI